MRRQVLAHSVRFLTLRSSFKADPPIGRTRIVALLFASASEPRCLFESNHDIGCVATTFGHSTSIVYEVLAHGAVSQGDE